MAQGGFRPAGQCRNCGSYELGPIEDRRGTPAPRPPDQR
jgi:hypothetical protein